MKKPKPDKKPPKKKWSRKYKTDPWNDPEAKLELFIAPDLKLRLMKLPPPKLDKHPAYMEDEE